MSILAANTATTDSGALKFTQAERDYLRNLLDHGDRGGYYMALYNMTGEEECLLQARIATFSDNVGGAAFVANALMQAYYGPQERYPGIYFLSQEVAKRSLLFIENELEANKDENTHTGYIDRNRMFESAGDAWINAWKEKDPINGQNVHNFFPGNLLSNEIASFFTQIEIPPLPNQQDAWTALVQVYNDLQEGGTLTAENFTNRLISQGALAAFVGAFGAAAFGKRLSDYEDMPERYQLQQLPGVDYTVVSDLVLKKVVAVFDTSFLPESLDEIFNMLAGMAPEFLAILFPSTGGLVAFKQFMINFMGDFRRQLTEGMPDYDGDVDPLLENPHGVGIPEQITTTSTALDDTLWGSNNADVIHGLGGNDRISGGGTNDELYGDDGNDLVYGQAGADTLYGGLGLDVLRGGNDSDLLYGGDGNDTLDGDDLNPDSVGNDRLYGEQGNDILSGGAGADKLFGGSESDKLYGGIGDDELTGGAGNDRLEGGQGNDTYFFSSDFDRQTDTIYDADGIGSVVFGGITISAGERFSEISWRDSTGRFLITRVGGLIHDVLVIQDLQGNSSIRVERWLDGQLGISLSGDIPDIVGAALTAGDDLFGEYGTNSGDNTIDGLAGNDGIEGGAGEDHLDGGADTDLIFGGTGNDHINGGAGNDYIYDGSELANMRPFIPGEEVNFEAAIASLGSDLIARGSTWYIKPASYGHTVVLPNNPLNQDPNQSPSGNDTIDAGDGDDHVYAGEGNDTISGGIGADYLNGGHDHDIIVGGSDNDIILGDWLDNPISSLLLTSRVSDAADKNGNDILDGGAGDDTVFGAGGDDTIFGGTDNDHLYGDGRTNGQDANDASDLDTDYIDGGAGNDEIAGNGGNDELLGGTGNDVIFGDDENLTTQHGDDAISGGEGDDTLIGQGGNDTIQGEQGIDTIQGDSFALDGSKHGNDLIYAGTENDTVFGMGGNDVIYGDDGNDVLLGDAEIEQLAEQFHGNDLLYGGAGADILKGGSGNDTLDGGIGADQLFGESGDDRLQGGAGVDLLVGGDGADSMNGGADNDNLWGDAGNDTLQGAEGQDQLMGGEGNDLLDGGSGNDSIGGEDGDDHLIGGEGTDTLDGGAGADHLEGGVYADNLYGGDGNDIIDGGEGSDYLYGGSGINQYVIGPTSGVDYIFNESPGTAAGSFVEFLGGIRPEDVTYVLSGSTLIVRYSSEPYGELRISGFASNAAQSPVSSFHFSNGIILSYEDIRSRLLASTGGNDFIAGFGSNDTIAAGLGNDTVNAVDGDDSVYGEAGGDTLYGGNGNDLVDGGSGDDLIYGDSGNDTLRGGTGNDRIYGGEGNDLFLYSRNDGSDYIEEIEDTDNSDTDIVRLGAGILPEHVTLYRARRDVFGYDELVIVVDGSNQQIWVSSYFSPQGNSIERLEFDNGNGPFWTETDIRNLLQPVGSQSSMAGTSGNDVLVVDHESDVVTEQSNGGIDLIESSRSFTISANVENMTLTGVLNINATGNTLSNTIRGNSGDNLIDGGGGTDVAYGGAGDDIYLNVEQVYENADEGIDTVYSSDQTIVLSNNVENLIVSGLAMLGSGGYFYNGNNVSNVIQVDARYGYSCLIDGGAGADIMSYKGSGNITFKVDDVGDQVIFLGTQVSATPASGQVISVESTLGGEYHLAEFVSSYSNTSTQFVSVVGNSGNNRLSATQAAAGSSLAGGMGDDVYVLSTGLQLQSSQGVQFVEQANEGFDTIVISSGESAATPENGFVLPGGAFVLSDNFEAVDLGYYQGNANLSGNASANLIVGNAWDNIIDGGLGADTMRGGQGSDTYYVDSIGDLVVEESYVGRDTVISSLNYALSSNVEDLILTGAAVSGEGNGLDNHLVGNALGNSLSGGSGNDNLEGLDGNDQLDGGAYDDTLAGGNGSDTYIFGRGYGSDSISNYDEGVDRYDVVQMQQGIALTDISLVRLGNDLIVKIVGTSDQVTINDYYLDDAYRIDAIRLFDGTVITAQDMDIPANNPPSVGVVLPSQEMVEGTAFALSLPENLFVDEPNEILELSFDMVPSWMSYDPLTRVLSGTPPNGAASGTFSITGTDSIGQSATTTLSYAVLNAVVGTANVDSLVGTSARDALFAYAGNDSLNGGAGADRMVGGSGDDTYTVDNTGDVIVEEANEGNDLVNASVSHTLSQEVERLTLTGTGSIGGTGNSIANVLTGNGASNTLVGLAGNDTLDGKAGADTLNGGQGDDVYIVDNAGDVVTEAAGEGTDLVNSSATYTLLSQVENIVLTGSSAISATGNTSANIMTGNSAINTLNGLGGNDVLDGKGGADVMKGGQGDDIYTVDNVGDAVTELTDEGVDVVNSSVTFTLSAEVESLALSGTSAINGTGNAIGNVLVGNSGNNNLSALAGNDTLEGKGGTDTLTGGTGNDAYLMARTYGIDTVVENDGTAGNTDVARFLTGVTYDQLWFKRPTSSNNLEISIIGTTDKLVIKDWYLGGQYRVEEIRTDDGNRVLYAADVQALVNAMAGMTPPPLGQTTLTTSQSNALAPTFSATWHDQPAGGQMFTSSLPAMTSPDDMGTAGSTTRRGAGLAGVSRPRGFLSEMEIASFSGGEDLYEAIVRDGFSATTTSLGSSEIDSVRTISDCRRLIDLMATSEGFGRERFNPHVSESTYQLVP